MERKGQINSAGRVENMFQLTCHQVVAKPGTEGSPQCIAWQHATSLPNATWRSCHISTRACVTCFGWCALRATLLQGAAKMQIDLR